MAVVELQAAVLAGKLQTVSAAALPLVATVVKHLCGNVLNLTKHWLEARRPTHGNDTAASLGVEIGHRVGTVVVVGRNVHSQRAWERLRVLQRHPAKHVAEEQGVVRRVRDHGIDEWHYAEQKQLAKMQFRFQEAVEPIALTRALAARWHEYPLEDLLYAGYRYDGLVKAQVIDYLSRMTPENLHLLLVAPGQETDQVDPWYGVRYRLTSLPKAWVAAWREVAPVTALSLPSANPFVPNDFSLRESPDTTPHPKRIVMEPGFDLWFDHDLEFGLPHSSLYFSVRSPQARGNARQRVLTELYIALVNDTLSELTYPAFLAGVNFKLYAHRRGFSLRIEGFNDRQPQLLEAILDRLAIFYANFFYNSVCS